MTSIQFSRWLTEHNACEEGRAFAHGKAPREVWETCPRGDWLLWWAGRAGVDRRDLVLAACACARLALPFVPVGETRPLKAIETVERWARGNASLEEVRNAAYAAAAARAAANTVADIAYAAAYAKRHKKCADAVRAIITWNAVRTKDDSLGI